MNKLSTSRRARVTAMLLLIGFVVEIPTAHAYLDPGTASLLLQGLIAGLAVIATSISLYWRRIKMIFVRIFSWFKRKKGGGAASPHGESNAHRELR